MKVQVTKVLVSMLKKEILKDEHFKNYNIVFDEVSREYFESSIDYNLFDNETDFDCATSKMKVIKIEYPENYYACNKYLTTNILNNLFKHSNKTLADFIQKVKEEIEI